MSLRPTMRRVAPARLPTVRCPATQQRCFGVAQPPRQTARSAGVVRKNPMTADERPRMGATLVEHIRVNTPPVPTAERPTVGNDYVEIKADRRDRTPMKIPAIWLRDHCLCSECVHPETSQRLLDTFAIPEDIAVESCVESGDTVEVLFSDGHKARFGLDFLARHSSMKQRRTAYEGAFTPTLWDSSIARQPPAVDYDAVMSSDDGVKEWTQRIREFGFCYVDGCPATPEATHRLLERIAFVRHTHYGGFWDFTSDLASKDTAYTSIALEAHNDNTYFTDPAGLQMFHLLSHTDGEGGASLLVDGFKVATDLRQREPEAYKTLAEVPVQSHASGNEGVKIAPATIIPVFNHVGPQLYQIRWNNSDRAAIHAPVAATKKWYWAARLWSNMLKDAQNEYWEQLKPGRPMIFDNWRVLHGRSAFTGKRRLCGGYVNRDDYMSRYRTLNLENGGSFF